MKREKKVIEHLNTVLASRDLYQSIIAWEEEHIDWLETRLALIDKVGLRNYQQSNMY